MVDPKPGNEDRASIDIDADEHLENIPAPLPDILDREDVPAEMPSREDIERDAREDELFEKGLDDDETN